MNNNPFAKLNDEDFAAIKQYHDEDNASETAAQEHERIVARVFFDIGGIYFCDNDLDYLDTRGCAYPTKAAAMRAAADAGYTHAIGSGTYWGDSVRSLARFQD